MSEDENVIKEINETTNRTGEVLPLIPFLCNPGTFKEAYEIWQNWIEKCDQAYRVKQDELGELKDKPF